MPKKHKKWDPQNMIKAVEAVRCKRMGYLKAAIVFGVPKGTVERYVKSGEDPEKLVHLPIGRKPILPLKLEEELFQHALQMEERFFGLRTRDIKRMAFQLAIRNNIPHPFNHEKKAAGKKWLKLFLKRHPQLSMRTPQGISAARVKSFTREKVKIFFDIYQPEYDKIKEPCHRIFNVDETGITVVQHKHSKVIAMKGKKQIAALTSAERGKLITIITCMNASGVYIPPVLIFPRKNMKQELMLGAPNGAVGECHISGWVQADIFTRWLKHFIKHTKPTAEDPVLLVLDGHYSHTRNISLIELAKQNHVIIVCLPPHSTNKMQPLDVSFMSPFKTYYAQEIENWLRENQLSVVSPYAVASIFCKAYNKAATMGVSSNGFRKTGLVPLNRHVFQDYEFSVEHKETHDDDERNSENQNGDDQDDDEQSVQDQERIDHEEADQELQEDYNQDEIMTLTVIERTSTAIEHEEKRTPSPIVPREKTPSPIEHGGTAPTDLILPKDICPLPAMKTHNTRKNARAGKAAVITSTPYKKDLEESLTKKGEKGKNVTSKKKRSTQEKIALPKRMKHEKIKGKKKSEWSSSESDDAADIIKYAESSSDESGGSDAECMFCMGKFSEDQHGEKWSKCVQCTRWAHEDCGELKAGTFLCSFCEGRGFFE